MAKKKTTKKVFKKTETPKPQEMKAPEKKAIVMVTSEVSERKPTEMVRVKGLCFASLHDGSYIQPGIECDISKVEFENIAKQKREIKLFERV